MHEIERYFRISDRQGRFAAILTGFLAFHVAFPATADREDSEPSEWTKEMVLDKKSWTEAELKEVSNTPAGGKLFSKGKDGGNLMDVALVLNYTCEQSWASLDMDNPEKISRIFGKEVIIENREYLDDGFNADVSEGFAGFTFKGSRTNFKYDEGNPNLRILSLKNMNPEDDPIDGTYRYINPGHPEYCIVHMKVLFMMPTWLPDWLVDWLLSYGAKIVSDYYREGLADEGRWPADEKARLYTPKGKQDREAWLDAQKTAPAAATDPVPIAAPADGGPVEAQAPTQDEAAANTTSDGGIQAPTGSMTTEPVTAEPVPAEPVTTKPETGEAPPPDTEVEKPPAP